MRKISQRPQMSAARNAEMADVSLLRFEVRGARPLGGPAARAECGIHTDHQESCHAQKGGIVIDFGSPCVDFKRFKNIRNILSDLKEFKWS